MLQIISFNVIKDALKWHGMPLPNLRQLSYSEYEHFFTGEYLARWEEWDVPVRYFFPPLHDGDPDGVARFKADLQACFCEDITVIEVEWHDLPYEYMTALIYCKVDKAVLAMDRFGANA